MNAARTGLFKVILLSVIAAVDATYEMRVTSEIADMFK
jgi:hypothetical protein